MTVNELAELLRECEREHRERFLATGRSMSTVSEAWKPELWAAWLLPRIQGTVPSSPSAAAIEAACDVQYGADLRGITPTWAAFNPQVYAQMQRTLSYAYMAEAAPHE